MFIFVLIVFQNAEGSVPKAAVAKVSELNMANVAVSEESALQVLWQHGSAGSLAKRGPSCLGLRVQKPSMQWGYNWRMLWIWASWNIVGHTKICYQSYSLD
jgi:hypothetical protein